LIEKRAWDPKNIVHLTIAGWTGRDAVGLEKHIKELEALGVKRPASTPIFYRVAASLLTISESVEVLGKASSGEVEPVIVGLDDELWVGVGSDHTDRQAETVGVSLSKQLCPKPVSRMLWRYKDVADRWDDLEISSFVVVAGKRRLYQQGKLRAMRPPLELIRLGTGSETLANGSAMFCGTLAVHGEISPAERFEMELRDPSTDEKLNAGYSIVNLPDKG
jgi:hypothetical protein